MKTKVVNVHKEPYDICIMRGTIYGNPYPLVNGDRTGCILRFRKYFKRRIHDDVIYLQAVEKLRGKKIGCCCDPLACHGGIYVEFLEQEGEWTI